MMSEFGLNNYSSGWDLEAIVKGSSISCSSNNSMNIPTSYDAWFDSLLEDLNHQNMEISSITNLSQELVVDDHKPNMKSTHISCESTSATISKRRKNKHKIIKMVQQAGGDRILSDKWNWRKYGEKVIKGSPYPRSYYRCSYSGGCSARKQVEESYNEPGLYLITYMEEHTHPYPTRRHSQAERSAKRPNNHSLYSTKLATTIHNESPNMTLINNTMITSSSESSTNNNKNNDQVFALQGEDQDDESNVDNDNNNQSVYFGNRLFEDDFFAGLDYLESLSVNMYD